jgi:hypothetical protein
MMLTSAKITSQVFTFLFSLVGQALVGRCAEKEIALLATPRSNMSKTGIDYRHAKVIRKSIETVFSSLQGFEFECMYFLKNIEVVIL